GDGLIEAEAGAALDGRGVSVVSQCVAQLGLASLVRGSEQFEPAHSSDRPQGRQGGTEEPGGAFVLPVGGRGPGECFGAPGVTPLVGEGAVEPQRVLEQAGGVPVVALHKVVET